MIRSTKHSLKFSNNNKKKKIEEFIQNYRTLAQFIIDDIWNNGLKDQAINVNIQKNIFEFGAFIPNEILKKWESPLSARMKQCVGKQTLAMLKSAIQKRKQQLFKLAQFQKSGIDHQKYRKLQSKIDKFPLVKPNASQIIPELDSRFIDFSKDSKSFDFFVQIKTIGKSFNPIKIPIKLSKMDKKWNQGKLLNGIRISESELTLIYEIEDKPKKNQGIEVGCDQGYKTVATFSDGQMTPSDNHGHNLESIQKKLARKKKGSKAFKKTQIHRKNYINWTINQIDFSNIKTVHLEKIRNIRKGKRNSRIMSHWTYSLIKEKLIRIGETEGFSLIEVSNEFRSQRCYKCGLVLKKQRKGKMFNCICGLSIDADLNASLNLSFTLPRVPYWVRMSKLNRSGFYWKIEGLFDLTSQEIIVPDDLNKRP